mmetsp:Transcript_15605/g.18595  ORF Transcript_15605/g.18595 Transcript_15605/m.18595 type:complete len:203 (-) Transcript_15605:117-725(-)
MNRYALLALVALFEVSAVQAYPSMNRAKACTGANTGAGSFMSPSMQVTAGGSACVITTAPSPSGPDTQVIVTSPTPSSRAKVLTADFGTISGAQISGCKTTDALADTFVSAFTPPAEGARVTFNALCGRDADVLHRATPVEVVYNARPTASPTVKPTSAPTGPTTDSPTGSPTPPTVSQGSSRAFAGYVVALGLLLSGMYLL